MARLSGQRLDSNWEEAKTQQYRKICQSQTETRGIAPERRMHRSALCAQQMKPNYCCPKPPTTVFGSVSTTSSSLPLLIITKLECSVRVPTVKVIVPVQFGATV